MGHSQLSWIASFIRGIADDVLSDVYIRGKHRDVILPVVVLPWLHAAAEPAKEADLEALQQAGEGLLRKIVADGDEL